MTIIVYDKLPAPNDCNAVYKKLLKNEINLKNKKNKTH